MATIIFTGDICTNACFSYNETDITPDYLARFGPAFGNLMGKPYELTITNGTSYSLTINAHTVSWQAGDPHIAIVFNDATTEHSFGTGAWKWTDQEANQYGIAFAETLYGCPDPVPGVPEPATWALMLIGFGLVAGFARIRKRRKDKLACVPSLSLAC